MQITWNPSNSPVSSYLQIWPLWMGVGMLLATMTLPLRCSCTRWGWSEWGACGASLADPERQNLQVKIVTTLPFNYNLKRPSIHPSTHPSVHHLSPLTSIRNHFIIRNLRSVHCEIDFDSGLWVKWHDYYNTKRTDNHCVQNCLS